MRKFQFGRLVKSLINWIWVIPVCTYILPVQQVHGQDRGIYLYGEVETYENTYKGFIRWGKEELFCFDYFNANKLGDPFHKNHKQSGKKKKKGTSWLEIDNWNISSIWDDRTSNIQHQFVCEFGDIKSIEVLSESKIMLELKNGVLLDIGGYGYNDVGATVRVMDEEIGEVKLKWGRIKKITFLPGTEGKGNLFGKPLYGTVKTYRKGTFAGYIQWDKEERIDRDILDGNSRDGEVTIAFGKISTIEKQGAGSLVTLASGRDFYLTGTNDVNSQNKGIIVYTEDIGEIEIPWKSFVSLDLSETPGDEIDKTKYLTTKPIEGKVFLYDNSTVEGKIVYDIDETWQLETLEANDDEIAYRIPFRNIRSIKPKNYNYSLVTLKNEETILLGSKRDITDENDGLLVFIGNKEEPRYISWDQVSEIVFK